MSKFKIELGLWEQFIFLTVFAIMGFLVFISGDRTRLLESDYQKLIHECKR